MLLSLSNYYFHATIMDLLEQSNTLTSEATHVP